MDGELRETWDRRSDRVAIVGFAPSWNQTPWSDPDLERWGMNALHKLSGDRPFSRWFQLHDLDQHGDPEHREWLRHCGIPVYVWPEHLGRWGIPTERPYPRDAILARFDRGYFTNTVSWLIALAVLEEFKYMAVYGVDMAVHAPLQSGGDEYAHQRPSCEYMLGIAEGVGIEVFVPDTSDLLKTPHLYGAESNPWLERRLKARLQELVGRKQQVEAQMHQNQAVLHQLVGAIDDLNYVLRIGSLGEVEMEAPTPPVAPLPAMAGNLGAYIKEPQ